MERIIYLDHAKYVAIILMIIGHCYWKFSLPYLSEVIYSFHMPLFFIISGYVLGLSNLPSLKVGILKFGRAYLKPYSVTCILVLFFIVLCDSFQRKQFLLYDICDWAVRWSFASGSFEGKEFFAATPIVGPVWFLFSLFWACLIYSMIKRKYSGFNMIVFVMLSFLASLFTIHYVRFPFSLQAGMSAVLLIWLGDVTRKNRIVESLGNNITVVIILIVVWGICVLKGSMVMSNCTYGLGLISILGAYAGALLFLKIISLIPNIIILLGGGYFGQKTLYILCAHEIFQYSHYIYGNPFEMLPFSGIVNLIIETVGELIIALCLTVFVYVLKPFFRDII